MLGSTLVGKSRQVPSVSSEVGFKKTARENFSWLCFPKPLQPAMRHLLTTHPLKPPFLRFQLVCRCCPTDGSHQPGRLHLPGDIREDSPAAALTQPGRSCRWPPKSWRSCRVGGGVRPRTQPSSDRPFAVPQQLFSRLRAAFAVKEK